MTRTIDDLIVEYLSFRGFKEGKAPVNGADPGKRIGKRIWRDEGLDIVSYLGSDPDPGSGAVLKVETMRLSMGLLRGKKDRAVAVGTQDPSELIGRALRSDPVIDLVARSRVLLPPFASMAAADMVSAVGIIGVRPDPQGPPGQFVPRAHTPRGPGGEASGEDISNLLDRKAPKEREVITGGGRRIGTLRGLVQVMLEMQDDELSDLLDSGRLAEFARAGLSSPSLEAILNEVGGGSGKEPPSVPRERFLLWVLESPMGPAVIREVAEPFLRRLMKCPPQEARRISEAVSPLIDERSAPLLVDLLFKVPAMNRPQVIRLLGRTGSQMAIDSLERLRDMSSVESDRDEARSALERLGAS
jgi:hypothetical protein